MRIRTLHLKLRRISVFIAALSTTFLITSSETSKEALTLKYWYDKFPTISVPCEGIEESYSKIPAGSLRGVGGINVGKDFPRKLYMDFQKSLYRDATGYNESPSLRLVVNVPSSSIKLYGFRVGFYDYCTSILAIVDSNGIIHDTLEVEIFNLRATILEFIINENYEIITYSLTPTSKESVPFYSEDYNRAGYEEIELFREDTVYHVVNGKFVKVSSIKYKSQIYTDDILSANGFLIRNGNEIPAE